MARQPYASPPGYQSPASGDNVPDPGSQDTAGAQPHHGSAPPSPCHNNDNLVNSTPCLLLSCTHREDTNASSVSQRGTVAMSSPASTCCCRCCPCCCPCMPWGLWVVNHGCWWWWPLARCSGQRERLASMVVVGREGLLLVCSLLMTTNRVSGFADACFGHSEEITSIIELTLLSSNGCIVQRKECSFG